MIRILVKSIRALILLVALAALHDAISVGGSRETAQQARPDIVLLIG